MSTSTPYYSVSNGKPVVVQGRPISQAKIYDQGSTQIDKEEDHSRQGGCKDVFWAILFYLHLGGIAGATIVYAPQWFAQVSADYSGGGRLLKRYLQDDADQEQMDVDPSSLIAVVGVSAVLGLLLATGALSFMSAFAETLIKVALWFNILIFGLFALVGFAVGSIESALIGLLMLAFSAYYAYRVWPRIPFAASNLVTAVAAVRQNLGLAFYAYLSIVLLFLWTIWWAIAQLATIFVLSNCNMDGECEKEVSGPLVFAFVLSFYWTAQVISNVVHVTTAGTVAEWWYDPVNANGCCSSAVRNSYLRSLTTSFGSICLGSLIVALIQTFRSYLQSMRENGDSFLACCAECLIGCIESLVEYFNKWAYVYVAIHGFGFMEAGKNVMALFRERGFTAIISDLMVDSVLALVNLGIGLITGLLALAVGAAYSISADSLVVAFIIGAMIGFSVSATLFSVVSSAVNTVIVCYAEAPNEFERNHPELSARMRESWRAAWPNDFNF